MAVETYEYRVEYEDFPNTATEKVMKKELDILIPKLEKHVKPEALQQEVTNQLKILIAEQNKGEFPKHRELELGNGASHIWIAEKEFGERVILIRFRNKY